MSGQTSKSMARDKAEPSKLIQELKRCKNELVTQKELLIGSVNRSKKNLRDFHFLEENGLSTRKLGFNIEENYDKLIVELELLVEDWYTKDLQPQTDPEREILKMEIESI